MIRKFLSSDLTSERLLSKDGRFSLFDGRLLDAGGFLVDLEWYKELKPFDEIVKNGHAIIVAEGGMGKSHVLREFCQSQQDQSRITRLDLVSCAKDIQGLKDAIADASRNKEFLFLDGLDEAVNLAGLLSRILQDVGTRVHVVIASRGIPQLNSLSDQLKWPMFSLLPYSRNNVRELCEEENVDFDAFMRKVERQNLGAVCSKPLGCKMLIALYRKTALEDCTTESLWRNLMERLCGENPDSKTRDLVNEAKSVPVGDAIRIATIAALALKLSGATFLSRIGDKPSKPGALDAARLFANRDDREAFNTLLLRSLFLYVDEGCYRFAHSSYMDFLAAQGLMEYLDEKEWGRVVFAPEGEPYPQWEGGIPWLAARNKDILEKTEKSRPDLLLGTDALVDKVGADEICQAILENADNISSTIRENPAIQSRYYALNSDKCARIIRKMLKTTTSDVVVDTAIDIVRRARLSALADSLVDVFCDETRDRSLRVSAGCALLELANKAQRRKCKKVLQGAMAHRLKSLVVRMAWPDLMSVEELIPLLESQGCHEPDSFSIWLENGGFFPSLSRLASKDKFRLLEWAVSEIQQKDGIPDCIADAKKSVFLHCWKEERSKRFVPLLAKGIAAYAAVYQSPFETKNDEWLDSSHIYSNQEFRNDAARRREVAKAIVENPQLSVDAIFGGWIALLQAGDGDFVLASLNATVNPAIKERWALCLRYLGYVHLPEKSGLWDELHREFPGVFSSNATQALAEMRKFEADLATKRLGFAKAHEKKEAENKRILSENVAWAHEILQNGRAKGRFGSLMAVMEQQRPHDAGGSFLDFRESALWNSLSEKELHSLVGAAYDFLLKCKGPWSDNHTGHPIYTQALCLLFSSGRDLLNRMPVNVWKKIAPELLRYLFDEFELLPVTLLHFKKIHPKTFLDVFFAYSKNQLHSNLFWEAKQARQFLADKEFVRLLRSLDGNGLSDDLRYALYGKFMEADYDLAADYVKNKYATVPLRSLGQRTIGCVLLAAPFRFPEFLKELAADPAWGVRWAELLLSEESPHHARMARILPKLSINDLMEFYSWLNVWFPPEKAPHHEGVYSPGASDHLYDFKSFVFNQLMSRVEPEAVSAIEELHRRFPADKWFPDCALRLRNQLLATECPAFGMDAVCKLLENKKRMQVIHSTDDLLQVVMASLGRYQTYLTGVDTPLVRLLWNEHNGRASHKKEEDLSDNLKVFLSQDLPGIVSNREVQLNRGRKGQKGSRTDIWINAFSDDRTRPLSLCIEVKGSWNREVKTAYKTQLVDKYMGDGGANAGIFLVGWFESEREKKKTYIDKKENIAKLLEEQERDLVGQGYKVKHLIVDCSCSLPPQPAKKSRNARKKKE